MAWLQEGMARSALVPFWLRIHETSSLSRIVTKNILSVSFRWAIEMIDILGAPLGV